MSVLGVQLGFSEPIEDEVVVGHNSPCYGEWDGGQLGGKPSWLNIRDIPEKPVVCSKCEEMPQLRFLCQLYAPLDQIEPAAFHRSLYVFGCPNCSSIKVLRCQLPKDNDFFPASSTFDTDGWIQHLPAAHQTKLCHVCGQRGKGTCPVQKVSFCGRHHQLEYKKHSKKGSWMPSVYAKSELVVEQEPDVDQNTTEEDPETLFDNAQDSDEDEDIEQEDLNNLVGSNRNTEEEDPVTSEFKARIKRAPEQCLRYFPEFKGDELWMLSEPKPKEIPSCECCGAERMCEFQIMPQMLYHLLQEHRKRSSTKSIITAQAKNALAAASEILENAEPSAVSPALKDKHDETISRIQNQLLGENELDWGVVCIYTCEKSCVVSGYVEEYAFRQPPP